MTLSSRRRGMRLLFVGMSAVLLLLLSTQSVLASVTWTSPVKSSPSFAYNFGQGLAKTTNSSGTTYLHSQYQYLGTANPGIYYRRGNSSATTWGTAKRLNSTAGFAQNGAIAASSKYVYVAYQRISSWSSYDPAASRPIAVRVNTSHGSSTAWLATKNFDAPDRSGRPAVAADGAWGYVAYTDAGTGDIIVARNNGVNSADVGWTAGVVGTTINDAVDAADGKDGYPVIAATGASVLVAWVSGDGTTISAKISPDNGQTWPADATTVSGDAIWDLSAAGSSGRLALAWAQANGIKAALYRNAAWGTTKTLASFTSTGTYRDGYGTSIAMTGNSRVGVAWSACTRVNCPASSSYGVNLRWRESSDNLASLKSSVTVASYTASSSRRYNDYPTAIMSSTPKRWVMYNVSNSSFTTFSTMVEVGSGTP